VTTYTETGYGVDELRAAVISREFEDGERLFLGANVNAGRAAVLLAHLLRGPNIRVMLGLSWTNLSDVRSIGLHAESTDFRDARWAEAYVTLDTMISGYRSYFSSTFVVSCLQVDRFGNTNLIAIGDDHGRPRLRGPGAIGSVSSSAYCDRMYIIPPRHDRQIFVERCDFISSPGFGTGGRDARKEMGLHGGGPRLCITERCVFDFDEETKAMRLKSLHAGHTVDEIIEHTGFEVIVPDEVPETQPPTAEELALLRDVIDPKGLLRD
jgi:glutaconate CoA-transferase subunit B